MARQSITLSEPNEAWLKSMVDQQEYSSKSELINDLIRQARKQHVQIDLIRSKIDDAEKSGFTSLSKDEILRISNSRLNV